jgi:hypothetical protein
MSLHNLEKKISYKRIKEKKTNPKLSLDFLQHQSLLTSLPAKQIRIKDNRNRG